MANFTHAGLLVAGVLLVGCGDQTGTVAARLKFSDGVDPAPFACRAGLSARVQAFTDPGATLAGEATVACDQTASLPVAAGRYLLRGSGSDGNGTCYRGEQAVTVDAGQTRSLDFVLAPGACDAVPDGGAGDGAACGAMDQPCCAGKKCDQALVCDIYNMCVT